MVVSDGRSSTPTDGRGESGGSAGAAMLDGVHDVTLPNGLKVLLKEAHHAPIVCVSVWYRAGSKHESAGTTGLAHLLEHMMFKGTSRHGKGEFDRILKENGAVNNASTWLDRTNYYEIIAADRVEIALELEADRMRGALFTQQDLIDEMPVVRNELERGEDNPHRKLFRNVQSMAFLAHPYHWPTIGWRSDVEAITARDIRAYYDTYYHPNNAYLVIVGDFKIADMMALVERHFGAIPAGPTPPVPRTVEAPQRGERRFTLREAGGTPYFLAGFKAPEATHEDIYALDLLAQILGQGRTSRLFEALVKTRLATSASAFNMAKDTSDPFLFFVNAETAPGADRDAVEAALWKEIDRLKDGLVTADELRRAKKQNRVDFIYARDRMENLAFAIGESEITTGYEYLGSYLDRINAVGPEQIREVARKYLIEDTRTVGWYVPTGETGGAEADDDEAAEAAEARRPVGAGPAFRQPSVVERGQQGAGRGGSAGGPGPAGSGAKVHRRVLSSGMTVLVQENPLNQTVEVQGALYAGVFFEDSPGLATLVARMLDRGTDSRTADEMAVLLESEGAYIDFGAVRETLRFSSRSLTEDFDLVLDLLADMLSRSTFPEDELELVRSQVINSIRRALNSTAVQAELTALRHLYGEDSPFARLSSGSEESLKQVTASELRRFHTEQFAPSRMVVAVVGDVKAPAVFARMEALFGGRAPAPAPALEPLKAFGLTRDVSGVLRDHIELPQKNQVDVVLARRGIERGAPDYYAAVVGNFILGGDFSSRLNKELRDNQGLTYGTHSRFSPGISAGPWVASIGVNPANVEKAVEGMIGIVSSFVEKGATQEELTTAQRYLTGSYPMRLETNGAVAGQLLEAELYGLGDGYIRRYPEIIAGLTLEEVNAAVARHCALDQAVLVTCGTLSGPQP